MALSFSFNPFTGNFDQVSTVSIGSPANGLSITSAQVLSLALSSTSTTGALSNTDWNTFNGKQAAGNYITALTGDGTAAGPGSAALTLATVNGSPGSFGSASNTLTATVNGKGLVTALAATAIQIAESQVTNLTTDLAGKLSTSLTNAHLFIGNGGVATDTAMSGDITINSTGVTAIGANKVTDSMIRQSAGLSVIGRGASSTGNVADITGIADQILRVNGAGTTLAFGSIDLSKSAAVGSSLLPVANGGTGLATLTANNVILGNGASTPTFVAPGTSGNVLTSNGTTWASAAPGAVGVNSLSTTGNLTAGVTLLDGSSAGFTATLPTAVGATGQQYILKNVTTNFNVVTIATTSSQTIDGSTTRGLYTTNESVTIVSDGANWKVLDHKTATDWATFPLTIGAVTTPPTQGSGATNVAQWRREGQDIIIRWRYSQGNAGTAGSGSYLFPIPNASGWTINTSVVTVTTSATGNDGTYVGQGSASSTTTADTNQSVDIYVIAHNSTNLGLILTHNTFQQKARVNSAAGPTALDATTVFMTYEARVPITGFWS